MKHTPGPWFIQGPKIQKDLSQTYWSITSSKAERVGNTYKMPGFFYPHSAQSVEEQESNAKLIAAAPELLEVLQLRLEWHSTGEFKYKGMTYKIGVNEASGHLLIKEITIAIIKKATS